MDRWPRLSHQMRLLDLCCGEGGASRGYAQAGFDVFGIDTDPSRLNHYPYDCDRADAIEYVLAHGHEYDLIHASPPCTGYSIATSGIPDRYTRYTRLIPAVRAACTDTGTPYIIENVYGARHEMRDPLLLCGRMFALGTHDADGRYVVLDRHRLFESTVPLTAPRHPDHHRGKVPVAGVYGGGSVDRARAKYIRRGGYTPHPNIRRTLMDVPWMTNQGVALAIPPAYTRHLGSQIVRYLTT